MSIPTTLLLLQAATIRKRVAQAAPEVVIFGGT